MLVCVLVDPLLSSNARLRLKNVDSIAIEVSIRPKLTGIVRGKAFLHVLRRRPIGCPDSRKLTHDTSIATESHTIMPNVMDMIESNLD
ncbi:hypothetical protein TNCV_1019691 [Trichonephila clavipes]|nr:hypothetical protein TNCV_1019691 [Trichonephila clavipes]